MKIFLTMKNLEELQQGKTITKQSQDPPGDLIYITITDAAYSKELERKKNEI